jgi:hypothetical protein
MLDRYILDPTKAEIAVTPGTAVAGLRGGEMMALEWRDVELAKRQICVQLLGVT